MAEIVTTRYESTCKYTLYIYVCDNNTELYNMYSTKIEEHNYQLLTNSHPDSGFDIFVPKKTYLKTTNVNKIPMGIKCAMVKHKSNGLNVPTGYYLYPRSSISKTNFRLANNVGIIDSGYRGVVTGMFDVIYSNQEEVCDIYTRLLQICTPTLEPFKVVLVNDDNILGSTIRNADGFGSTGR